MPLNRPHWWRCARLALPVAAVLASVACETQKVLDPNATQPGVVIASIALRDALDRVVPELSDRTAAEVVRATLAPLERHLLAGDIVHARATLWHLTRILDSYRNHPDDAVRVEIGAIRLAVWVVYDYLKIPFDG